MDHADYWAGWLRDPFYAPEEVERDLIHLADLGVNMVSIERRRSANTGICSIFATVPPARYLREPVHGASLAVGIQGSGTQRLS